MGKGERPEHMAPPDIFYNEDEARKYTTNRCVTGASCEALSAECDPSQGCQTDPLYVARGQGIGSTSPGIRVRDAGT